MTLSTEVQNQITARACNSFMTIELKHGRFSGMNPIIDKARGLAASATDAEQRKWLLSIVNKLTPLQKSIALCTSAGNDARSLFEKVTTSTGKQVKGQQTRATRVAAVTRIVDIMRDLKEAKAIHDFRRSQLCYGSYANSWAGIRDKAIEICRETKIENYIPRIQFTADEVFQKMYLEVGTPKPIARADLSTMSGVLSADVIDEWQREANQELIDMFESANENAMKEALERMNVLVKQLDGGQRLSDSLIENTRSESARLRELATGYDMDMRIIGTCDMLDEHVGRMTTEIWKTDDSRRAKSLEVAKLAKKNIEGKLAQDSITKPAPKQVTVTIAKKKTIGANSILNRVRKAKS